MTHKSTILFRCDGGEKIGMGHIVGATRFATLLKEHNNLSAHFIIHPHPASENYLRKRGISFSNLHDQCSVPDQIFKIEQIAQNLNAKIIVFNLSASQLHEWEDQFSNLIPNYKIIFQDNPMKSSKYGDLVINALPHPDYEGYNPDSPRIFDGLQYMLFDRRLTPFLSRKRIIFSEAKRILIAMGGSDEHNLTSQILETLGEINVALIIDVVVGAACTHIQKIKSKIENLHHNVFLHVNTSNMAELIWNADIGINSVGLTTYEMGALRLPCLMISTNEVNSVVAEVYSQKFHNSIHLGSITEIDSQALLSGLNRLMNNYILRSELSNNSIVAERKDNSYHDIFDIIKSFGRTA